jgi:hypothetical protein
VCQKIYPIDERQVERDHATFTGSAKTEGLELVETIGKSNGLNKHVPFNGNNKNYILMMSDTDFLCFANRGK